VCEAFAREGWCDREPGTCPELHVWECGEFREKGTCSRGGKCGLRHVLKAEKGKVSTGTGVGEVLVDTAGVSVPPGSFEENTDFVNLDQGSPPEISEEEEEQSEEIQDDNDDDSLDGPDSEESGESDNDSNESEDEVLGVVG
jgi:hypothetical protein